MKDAGSFLNEIKPPSYLEFTEYDFQQRMEMTLMRIAKTLCPKFEIDDHNRDIYENGIRYFAGDESGKYDTRKGLFVYGDNGVGKTLFFKIFHELNRAVDSPNDFRTVNICDIIDGVNTDGMKYFSSSRISPDLYSSWRKSEHLLLDDLGQSVEIATYYGNNINVGVEFLQRRHYVYTDSYALTHCTSNLAPSDMEKKYGKYIKSRMKEMFNIIFFPGTDRRG